MWKSDNNRWTVDASTRANHVQIVDTRTGLSYDGIRYDDGRCAFDNAHQIPEYVKRAARLTLQRMARVNELTLADLLRNGGV